jgi:hypothetical protein
MFILFGFLGFLIPFAILVGVIYFLVKVSRKEEDVNSLRAKEVLVDTGIFISLTTSIVAIVSIVFSAIDKKFVDVLKSDSYGAFSSINEDVRVAVSIIAVIYPIYIALAYYRAKYLTNNKDRRDIPAMRNVNYITLGAAAVFIIGSVVTTIYQYLGGDLGVAFFYKIATVLAISLALGFYNYFSLKRNYENKTSVPNILAVLSLIAVVSAVVYSINILGSPAHVRKVKFDEKRLNDLSNIQQNILSYWQGKKVLPANMQDINNDGFNSGFFLPKDPRSKDPYMYKIIENSKLIKAYGQDCATFYPNKFNSMMNTNGYYDISKLSCEIPSKAIFEICANFETVRAYDENGMDQSGQGWDAANSFGVKSIDSMSARYYEPMYYDSYTKNPNWNHDKGETCFKRTIDPLKYPSYN